MLVECEMRGLTPFQTKWVEDLKASSGFDKFVKCDMTPDELEGLVATRPHPVKFLYYTKDGRLHLDTVGQKRVLRQVVST
jgi:hypothetical protein